MCAEREKELEIRDKIYKKMYTHTKIELILVKYTWLKEN